MNNPAIILPLIVLVFAALFLAVYTAAKRFAARKEHEGSWGPDGPLHPTVGPPSDSDIVPTAHIDRAVREYHEARFAEEREAAAARRRKAAAQNDERTDDA